MPEDEESIGLPLRKYGLSAKLGFLE